MQRIYQGKYFEVDTDGNETVVSFQMDVTLDENLSFIGSVWEEQFSGITGKTLSVKGFINSDHISFVKCYPCLFAYDESARLVIDETKDGHEVIYDGYWNDDTGIWQGEWEVEWEVEGKTEVLNSSLIQTRIYLGRFEMSMLR